MYLCYTKIILEKYSYNTLKILSMRNVSQKRLYNFSRIHSNTESRVYNNCGHALLSIRCYPPNRHKFNIDKRKKNHPATVVLFSAFRVIDFALNTYIITYYSLDLQCFYPLYQTSVHRYYARFLLYRLNA